MSTSIQPQSAITLATDIVAAYVSNNSVPEDKLTDLIKQVHRTVREADSETAGAAPGTEKPTAAQIRKSITDDALISFIDGKPYKTLKRHLTLKGLTPDQYKLKYGLPPDYPMIASSYSKQRSDLAKLLGLGQRGRAASQAEAKIDEIASEPIGTTASATVETPNEEPKTTRRGNSRRSEARSERAEDLGEPGTESDWRYLRDAWCAERCGVSVLIQKNGPGTGTLAVLRALDGEPDSVAEPVAERDEDLPQPEPGEDGAPENTRGASHQDLFG